MFTPHGDGISYLSTTNEVATYGIYLRGYAVMLATVDESREDSTLVVKRPGADEFANAYDTGHIVQRYEGKADGVCVRTYVFMMLPLLLQAIHDPQFATHMKNGADPLAVADIQS